MTDIEFPMIDPSLHPSDEAFSFDLTAALNSVVSIQSKVPERAYTAGVLGMERAGHGVVIGDKGLILTIGYLVVEAETIWLVDNAGGAVPGHVAGYDHETGFGLIQALGHLSAPEIPLGRASELGVGDKVILAGHGGRPGAITAQVEEKREFAGYWEYLLEEAIFTTPAHPFWGGAALIGPDGTLRGIGSLFVQQNAEEGTAFDGNMIVPIDLLEPVIDDLCRFGKVQKPPRPWIGALSAESDGKVIIVGLWNDGPAERAGLQPGDLIVAVNKTSVSTLPEFFRAMWSLGDAGVEVPLDILRAGRLTHLSISSANRGDFYISPQVH